MAPLVKLGDAHLETSTRGIGGPSFRVSSLGCVGTLKLLGGWNFQNIKCSLIELTFSKHSESYCRY